MVLQGAMAVIGSLIALILAIIAWNVKRIYQRVDSIDTDIKISTKRLWDRLTDHGNRIVRLEVQTELRRSTDVIHHPRDYPPGTIP